METRAFDDFLLSLQAQVISAQKKLKHQYENRIKKYINIDDKGQLDVKSITAVLPLKNGEEQKLELPLAALFKPSNVGLKEVLLELNVEIEDVSNDDEQSPRLAFVIHKKKRHYHTLHKLQIKLIGEQPGRVEVLINGQLFKQLDLAA